MKSISRSHHSTLNELNITPLLDLVFVLLVIFIITTPQLVNNLEIALPTARPPQKPKTPPPPVNRILVSALRQIFLDGESLSTTAFTDRLRQLKTANPDLRVVVKAEDETDYQSMVRVLDTLQQLEITKVGLATDAAGAGR